MTDANEAVRVNLTSGRFDFLDFGCGTGSSIELSKRIFDGKNGLGLDIDPKNVESTRTKGFEALTIDVTEMSQFPDTVSFSVMSHFLEHLSGYQLALRCIAGAVTASRDFVFIRQPWFDSDPELARIGLKLFWSDWVGHSYKMTTLDFCRAIRDVKNKKIISWGLFGYRQIRDSSDQAVHPLSSPPGQSLFEERKHGQKLNLVLPSSAYAETICVIQLSKDFSVDRVIARFYPDTHALQHHQFC